MSNFSLTRPTCVGWMTTASAYTLTTNTSALTTASANTLGSCREITFTIAGETLKATSSKNADAIVATAYAGMAGTITMVLEEMTSSALKLAWLMTNSGNLFTDGNASAPTDYGIYSVYWPVDGSSRGLMCYKCNIVPGSARKLGRDQELLELSFDVLADPSASAGKQWFGFLAD